MPTSIDEIGRRHRGIGGARGGNLGTAAGAITNVIGRLFGVK